MYDQQESHDNAAACRQIEHDQEQYERDRMLEERRKQDANIIQRKEKK